MGHNASIMPTPAAEQNEPPAFRQLSCESWHTLRFGIIAIADHSHHGYHHARPVS